MVMRIPALLAIIALTYPGTAFSAEEGSATPVVIETPREGPDLSKYLKGKGDAGEPADEPNFMEEIRPERTSFFAGVFGGITAPIRFVFGLVTNLWGPEPKTAPFASTVNEITGGATTAYKTGLAVGVFVLLVILGRGTQAVRSGANKAKGPSAGGGV